MVAKMATVILAAAAVVVALAGQTALADDHDLYEYCSKVDDLMQRNPETWANSTIACETALKVNSFGKVLSRERRVLARAWRAVTFDEACSSKSLAYVHSIYACSPGVNPSQKHLHNDAFKYAQKCLTNEVLEEEFKKFAGDNLEKFLTSDLLAAYYQANPHEPPLHFGFPGGANCCKPERATKVLVEAVTRDFPQEAAKIKAKKESSSELVDKLLGKHLYRPCFSYVKRVDKIMDEIEAAARYALDKDLSRLPQDIQDAIFRYKVCQNLKYEKEREEFNEELANAFV